MLRNGGVIAMPTDTLYALTAAADDAAAVRRVFAIKGREQGRPLPLFVSGIEMAERIAESQRHGAAPRDERFWPGQLTIVVSKRQDFDSEALAGSQTVGLRVPDNAVARAVVEALGAPVTGTSANLSGGPTPSPPTKCAGSSASGIDLILDAGPCATASPRRSSTAPARSRVILRQGAIAEDRIMAALRGLEGTAALARSHRLGPRGLPVQDDADRP